MDNYLKDALEIVKAQAGVRIMTEDEITGLVKKLADNIRSISNIPEADAVEKIEGVDPKKAIKERTIICVVCGKSFKLITKKHLLSHGLTPDEYREQCGYKKGTRLVCKGLQRERRKKMQEMQLWQRRGKKAEAGA
ncbi:MAG: MucR family transcriptional regulator [Desulfovibrio sp.]|jgi:predicted transcriptional regulator|nr:MucR family transcriptional regulator [Desulfovibrio sp.]